MTEQQQAQRIAVLEADIEALTQGLQKLRKHNEHLRAELTKALDQNRQLLLQLNGGLGETDYEKAAG